MASTSTSVGSWLHGAHGWEGGQVTEWLAVTGKALPTKGQGEENGLMSRSQRHRGNDTQTTAADTEAHKHGRQRPAPDQLSDAPRLIADGLGEGQHTQKHKVGEDKHSDHLHVKVA